MGLFSTAAIIAVIAIVIAAGLFVAFHKTTSTKLTALQAEALVTNDIKAQNPSAAVTVVSNQSSALQAGSWQMTLSVVYNGSRPCPTVLIEQFDYPALGLHPTNDTQASSFSAGTCKLYVYGTLPPYAPLFIASSYASNNPAIESYVSRYGYNNISVMARFIGQSSVNSTILGNETNVWQIGYGSSRSNHSLCAILGQNGTILQSYNSTSC